MKVIRWKHIACALGIAAHTAHLKSEIWYKTVWIHEKAPSTEVRNWLWVIMHKHQMPWHFLSLPNNHLPLLCLFAINDWILYPFLPHPSPEKKSHFCFVYISPIHTAATSTHGSMHSKAYLQPLDGGLWKQSWLVPSFLKALLCALGLEAFCGGCTCTLTGWRRERERDRDGDEREGEREQERERESFCSI